MGGVQERAGGEDVETAGVDSSFKEFDGSRGRTEIEGSWQGLGSGVWGEPEVGTGACVSMPCLYAGARGDMPLPQGEGPGVWELKRCPWGVSHSGLSAGPVSTGRGDMTLPMNR